jgi:hypothetical protein
MPGLTTTQPVRAETSDPADVEGLARCRELREQDRRRELMDLDVQPDRLEVVAEDLSRGRVKDPRLGQC